MGMADVRAKYPQYDDLSDDELLRGLHAKHYSDVPYDQFAARVVQDPAGEAPGKPGYYQNLRDNLVGTVKDAFTDPMGGVRNAAGLVSSLGRAEPVEEKMNVLGEVAASANRGITGVVDVIPEGINAARRLYGSDQQVPTLRGAMEPHGIEGGFMEPGIPREVARGAGTGVAMAMGGYPVARNAATARGAAAEIAGFGSAKTGPGAVGFGEGVDLAAPWFDDTAKNVQRELALKRGSGDVVASGYKLDEAGKAVKDPLQRNLKKQGYAPGFIAMVKNAGRSTRKKMEQMVNIVEAGRANELNKSQRPSDALGKSVMDRIRVVNKANRMAANRLEGVSQKLKGKKVDSAPALKKFMRDLRGLDIKIDDAGNLDFETSMIQGMDDVQGMVKRMVDRLQRAVPDGPMKPPDAWEVHRAKRFIDHQVTFGKKTAGLDGQVEGIFKRLRHNLDKALDAKFPEYDAVNTQYSETIQGLDNLQKAIGMRVNFFADGANSAVGTAMRKLLSNYTTRQELDNTVVAIDKLAKKFVTKAEPNAIVPYGKVAKSTGVTNLDDDILQQVHFVNNLEAMFGTHAGQSAQGVVEKGVTRAYNTVANPAAGAVGLLDEGIHKARGINEKNALSQLIDLLKETD